MASAEDSERRAKERDEVQQELQPVVRRLAQTYGSTQAEQGQLTRALAERLKELVRNHISGTDPPIRPYLIRHLTAAAAAWAEAQDPPDAIEAVPGAPRSPHRRASLSRTTQGGIAHRGVPGLLNALSAAERAVFSRRYYSALPFSAIADELDITPMEARFLLRSAMGTLRRMGFTPPEELTEGSPR